MQFLYNKNLKCESC